MSNLKTIALTGIAIVALGGGAAYLFTDSSNEETKSKVETTTTTTTSSTTKSSESTTSSTTSEETTTKGTESQSTVETTQQTSGITQVQPVVTVAVQSAATVQPSAPAQAPATTVILGKTYSLDERGRMATADQMEVREKYAAIEAQKQAGQQADLANTALIPNLTADQPMPVTYADIRNANTGWPLKVKGVIEAQLGKPLTSATNTEIQSAVANVAARDGFRDAVKS